MPFEIFQEVRGQNNSPKVGRVSMQQDTKRITWLDDLMRKSFENFPIAYSEPCKRPKMEIFRENSSWVLAFGYFHKELHLRSCWRHGSENVSEGYWKA